MIISSKQNIIEFKLDNYLFSFDKDVVNFEIYNNAKDNFGLKIFEKLNGAHVNVYDIVSSKIGTRILINKHRDFRDIPFNDSTVMLLPKFVKIQKLEVY